MRPEILLMAEVIGMMIIALALTAVAVSKSLASTPGPTLSQGELPAPRARATPIPLRLVPIRMGKPDARSVMGLTLPCPRTEAPAQIELGIQSTTLGPLLEILACDQLGPGSTCSGGCLDHAIRA